MEPYHLDHTASRSLTLTRVHSHNKPVPHAQRAVHMARLRVRALLPLAFVAALLLLLLAATAAAADNPSGSGKPPKAQVPEQQHGEQGNQDEQGQNHNDGQGHQEEQQGHGNDDQQDADKYKDHGPKPKPKPKPMKVKCYRKTSPYCYGKPMECPASCPQSCFADCNACKPVCVCSVPGACGDPRFIGGDGNAFYFHGRRDADFCVLSDRDLHINAHFIGKRGADGMSRDFTWIQAIAVLFDVHRLYVGARKTAAWDDDVDRMEISLDGEPPLLLPQEADGAAVWTSAAVPGLSVTRTKAANGVLVALDGRFSIRANAVPITAEESRVHRYGVAGDDCLAHLDLAFKFDALTADVHGVVGQTYRADYVNRFDVKAAMPTMGGDSNFTTSGLFALDCAVARFAPRRHGHDDGVAMAA